MKHKYRALTLLVTVSIVTGHTISALADTGTAAIKQVSVYQGASASTLFNIYTNAKQHSAATHPASGDIKFVDTETGKAYAAAKVGLELQGFYGPDGKPQLVAKVLEIHQDKRIVMQWINSAWKLATDKSQISDMPSLLVLEFKDNTIGAEIILTQVGVPSYQAAMSSSPFNAGGEVGPLSEIIRVHWEMAYWQPIRHYLANR